MCDDINITVRDNEIVDTKNACEKAHSIFLHQRHPPTACQVDGQSVSLEQGIRAAAEILKKSQSPFVYGLGQTTTETQRAAVALADYIGAGIDCRATAASGHFTAAVQQHGQVTCSLGEIKNRADLVVFWNANPLETHPRLLQRIGNDSKHVVVVDDTNTATAKVADQFISLENQNNFLAIREIQSCLKNKNAPQSELPENVSPWSDFADQIINAKYGVIFVGTRAIESTAGYPFSAAILKLIRKLNQFTRFSCLPLHGQSNSAGAENVLTWQTGFPFGVELRQGYPEFNPVGCQLGTLLDQASIDVAVCVSGDPHAALTDHQIASLGRNVSLIRFCDGTTERELESNVSFGVAPFGISVAGSAYRFDGVPLPMRIATASHLQTREMVLQNIQSELESAQ